LNHKIALTFEDGVTRFIQCLPDEKVADAAYRSGIMIPLDCRDGVCGTCKSHCESGTFSMSDYLDDALSAQEAATGLVLTCKMKPQSDCVVRIPVSSTACSAQAHPLHTARVAALEQLSATAISLTLDGDAIGSLDFLPGQYANLCVPGSDESRAYSFSSLVNNGAVSFLIRNVPEGKMSEYLSRRAARGDQIQFQSPYGTFYLRATERPLLMVAGGTGLAPFLAMLEHLGRVGCSEPIHLVYGVTRDEDLVATEVLRTLSDSLPRFTYTTCVAVPEAIGANRGFVTDYLLPEAFHAGNVDLYLCGPPAMLSAVDRFMQVHALVAARLYYEKFLSTGEKQ
jgi:benzoate/toluate 1,2-dioxygenase reductase subunit